MSITLELEESVEQALRERAASEGVSVESYVLRLAEREIGSAAAHVHPKVATAMRMLKELPRIGPMPDAPLDARFLYGEG